MNHNAVPHTPVASHLEVATPNLTVDQFYGFKVITSRPISDLEISQVSGCIGYALRQVLAGEDLSLPKVHQTGTRTILEFGYDSTKSQRDDPNFEGAFWLAKEYVSTGTPIRSTNRAGAGTKGTSLVNGVPNLTIGIYLESTGQVN